MRPLFSLTTELISIPTGFIFLVAGLGTLYRAKIRFEVPMLFCLSVYFNFLIGGVTGVFLADVPVNVTVHGGFFVLSHFHYTIMGLIVFAFMGAFYFWIPKMTGKMMNKKIGTLALLDHVRVLQFDVLPDVHHRPAGSTPTRLHLREEPSESQRLLFYLPPICLGFSFLIFCRQHHVVAVHQSREGPGQPVGLAGLEWQTATPIPRHNFDHIPVIMSDPYHYSEPNPPALADFGDDRVPSASASSSTDSPTT